VKAPKTHDAEKTSVAATPESLKEHMHRALGPALIVLAVALAGCGGGIAPGADTGSATSTPVTGKTYEPATTPAPEPTVSVTCPQAVLDLVDSLNDLNSRLTVGLKQDDYNDRVGDAKVTYDKLNVDDIDAVCATRVAVKAESALNAYIDANNTWNDCIVDPACDGGDPLTKKLQKKWSEASDLLAEIATALK
jgi:hypothetical protein